jgi:hypothetical protein
MTDNPEIILFQKSFYGQSPDGRQNVHRYRISPSSQQSDFAISVMLSARRLVRR